MKKKEVFVCMSINECPNCHKLYSKRRKGNLKFCSKKCYLEYYRRVRTENKLSWYAVPEYMRRNPPGNTKLIANKELIDNCIKMYSSKRTQDKYLAIRLLSKVFSKDLVKTILGCKESTFNAAINSSQRLSE
ncbi:MAG: hypothetical protein ACUVQP_00175 [Bacteroidales bacterium]